MPISVTAHLRCDYCGAKKDIDITHVPLDEHHALTLKAVYATHGFTTRGRTLICDACRVCFEDVFKEP